MKIAAYQGKCPDDLKKRLHITKKIIQEASLKGVDILCFPECFLTGYYDNEAEAWQNSIDLDAHGSRCLFQDLSEGDLAVIIGCNERDCGKLYNTAVVVEEGKVVGRYRKSYLYKDYFSQGLEFPIFEKLGIHYGIMICLDANYLEPSRILAMKGARLILCPMFNRVQKGHPFLSASSSPLNHLVARAFENDAHIVTADVVHPDDGMSCCPGFSRAYNRNGEEVLSLKPFEEGLLIQEVSLREEAPRKRRRIFGDPALFSILSNEYEQYKCRK